MSPTARTLAILDRFPSHLDADAPGKLFSQVVDALDHELDVKSVQLGEVRRSHALGDADQQADLLLLAGLHELGGDAFQIAQIRLDAARAMQRTLSNPSSSQADQQAAIAALPAVLGLQTDSFPSWSSEGTNTAPAIQRLAAALVGLTSYRSELNLMRRAIGSVISLHRAGNGAVRALLGAAAAYLDLEIDSVADSDDHYWHVATCTDVLGLVRPEPPGSRPPTTTLVPPPDLVAVEDNPLRQDDSDPVERRHRDRFQILRRGFESVPATVRIVGVSDRTVAPMVVSLDTGFGVAFTGSVPDGQELRFEADGRVTLAGVSVARLSYSFSGGLFADATKAYPGDFVFAGGSDTAQVATFAITTPIPDAFDPSAVFPHTESLLGAATLPVGESRWAFFVRAGDYGRTADTPADELAVPVFNSAVFDGSVFEPSINVGSPSSGKVGFSWQEHEPFAARLWIPLRFSTLDKDGEVPITERLRLLLDRHRSAAIHVYVEYADSRWSLPGGLIRAVGSGEPLGTVIEGTTLWSPGTQSTT